MQVILFPPLPSYPTYFAVLKLCVHLSAYVANYLKNMGKSNMPLATDKKCISIKAGRKEAKGANTHEHMHVGKKIMKT